MPPVDRAVFRLPASALFVPVLLFMITAPLASASVWTVGLFIVPVIGVFYVLWTRTVVDAHTITVFRLLSRHVIPWADLDGFEFHGTRWAIAVTLDGRRTKLPMVRPRDLPQLAAVSGGRLYLGETAVQDAEAAAESETTRINARGDSR